MRLTSSTRASTLPVTADRAWLVVAGAGPGRHWYADALPLRFRALLDRAVGGAPLADPPDRALLEEGDAAGLWRVRRAEGHVLELDARVRAPGTVTLRSELVAAREVCRLTQTVTFRPHGLAGTAYLLADLPAREAVVELVHRRVVADVLKASDVMRRGRPGDPFA